MKIKKIPEVLDEKGKDVKRSRDGVLVFEIDKNDDYSIAYGELAIGEKNKMHKIEMQELYYFIQGMGKITVNSEKRNINQGDIILVPENATQKLENNGNEALKFLMIVNPPYNPEKEQILE